MWKRVVDRGLLAGRVVLCTPISAGACTKSQICLLLSEYEMWFFVLRLLSPVDATFPSLWFQIWAD